MEIETRIQKKINEISMYVNCTSSYCAGSHNIQVLQSMAEKYQ